MLSKSLLLLDIPCERQLTQLVASVLQCLLNSGKPGSKGAPDIYLPAPSFRRHDARGLLADDYYVVWGRSFRRSVRLHTLDTHGVRIPIHAHSAERK